MRNNFFFSIVCVFIIVNIIDLITAYFILPGEANLLYLLTGTYWSLIIVKIFVISLILYVYYKNVLPSRFWHFTFVYIVLISIILTGIGAYSNITAMNNPEVLEQASKMSVQEKSEGYGIFILFLYVVPYMLSAVSFKLFEHNEKTVRYENDG